MVVVKARAWDTKATTLARFDWCMSEGGAKPGEQVDGVNCSRSAEVLLPLTCCIEYDI